MKEVASCTAPDISMTWAGTHVASVIRLLGELCAGELHVIEKFVIRRAGTKAVGGSTHPTPVDEVFAFHLHSRRPVPTSGTNIFGIPVTIWREDVPEALRVPPQQNPLMEDPWVIIIMNCQRLSRYQLRPEGHVLDAEENGQEPCLQLP